MNCDNNGKWWPVNHRTHSKALEHYTRELALAQATQAAQSSEQIARLAVAEAHRQRARADALERRVQVLVSALGVPG